MPPQERQATAAEALRRAGLRVTAPRVGVLDALAANAGHHSVADVERLVRQRLGAVSTQGVYDVLRALDGAGLVRRIELSGAAAHYEAQTGDNHHHLICRSCGRVVDVDCAVGAAPCLQPADTRGFTLDQADITFRGRCPDCHDEGAHA